MLARREPCAIPVAALALDQEDPTAFLTSTVGYAQHQSTVVDVACAAVDEDSYSGDVRLRQSVELKFGDFVAYYKAKLLQTTHWLMDTEDDLQLYLAQCPMHSTSSTPAVLPGLLPAFPIPPILTNLPLTQVNLWMSIAESKTTLHYDAYDNVLRVVRGAKKVKLFAPTENVSAHPIYSKSTNHSMMTISECHAQKPTFEFIVNPTTALFIPEGWWHQVSSEPFTVAVNYWFDGLRPKLVECSHMLPYYARVVIEELVTIRRKAQIQAYISHLGEALHQNGLLPFRDVSMCGIAAFIAGHPMKTHLLVCSPNIYNVCLALSTDFPHVWKHLLLKEANVECIEFLTEAWDDHESLLQATQLEKVADYFETIYAPFTSVEQEALQLQLLQAKESFAKTIAIQTISETLGFTSPNPPKAA